MDQINTDSIADTLILGIGNVLMGDEGFGVHFARMMENEDLPPGVAVLEGGTAGMQLMEAIESHRYVLLVDATLDKRPPGTVREIKPRFSSDYPAAMSTHDIGLKDLISGLTFLGKLPEVYLFVVSVAELQPMYIGLSSEVEVALASVKEKILNRINQLREEEGS